MTDETTMRLQQRLTSEIDRRKLAERQVRNLQAKVTKQRSELARTIQKMEALAAQKAALHRDLTILKKAIQKGKPNVFT